MTAYIVPAIIVFMVIYATFKKVSVYDSFVDGAKEAGKLILTVFPYISAIFICIQLFKISGLAEMLSGILAKPLSFFGIPPELGELLLLRPVSGNGSIALLETIFETYGADSYIGKCAAVIMGSTETIFYISAVYFSGCDVKHLRSAIPISLFATFLGTIVACLLCRFF
ncbi:MAG: spore maturation protein [Clostridia bacterium]